MNEFFYDSALLILKSLLIGAIIGAVFDFFRILRISRAKKSAPRGKLFEKIKPRKPLFKKSEKLHGFFNKVSTWLAFFEDVLFFIISAIVISLFFLIENDGEIRIYCLVFSCVGFFVYYVTAGKIIIKFSEEIIFCAECLLYWIFYIIILPIRFILSKIPRNLSIPKSKISRKYVEMISRKKAAGIRKIRGVKDEKKI